MVAKPVQILCVPEMNMLRWTMCAITRNDRIKNGTIRGTLSFHDTVDVVLQECRLRLYFIYLFDTLYAR